MFSFVTLKDRPRAAVLVVAVMVIGFGASNFTAAPQARAGDLAPDHIAATSQAFFDTMNAGDMEAWIATLSPDVVSYEPVGSPPNRGHDGLMAWAQANAQMGFQSVVVEVHRIIVAGAHAAITWTTEFTLPDGRVVAIEGVDTHAFDEAGLIREINGYFDPSPLMAAMAPPADTQ